MDKRVIIAAGIFILMVAVISGLFLVVNRDRTNDFTGGSGQPAVGTLVLTGYETPSNDDSHIPLGDFLTSSQQSTIRTQLEKILFKSQPEREYDGHIMPGTVAVDYLTNDIDFKVEIDQPEVVYAVQYNTVSDEIHIYDEEGTAITTD